MGNIKLIAVPKYKMINYVKYTDARIVELVVLGAVVATADAKEA